MGIQTLVLATSFNPIYWNTACLVVNSGSLEDSDKSTDYAKIARALGVIISRGVKVTLVDINKSQYGFEPDIENNQILFGMKALNNVGAPIIAQIIQNRPYTGIADFMARCPINKSATISLIKAGAFDNLEESWSKEEGKPARILIMAYYLSKNSDLKQKITLQNLNGLIQSGIVPATLTPQIQVFKFNKNLKKSSSKQDNYYFLNDKDLEFYVSHFDESLLEVVNERVCILQARWEKIYQAEMNKVRDWVAKNQESILLEYNTLLFASSWEKYAAGDLSSWEMEALCFYYHDHELAKVNTAKYGIVDFNTLSPEPDVDYYFKRKGQEIPVFKTYKIIGTVIGKDDTRSTISLLTTTGVVNVKFSKDYFAMFARQLSEKQEDGTKKVVEKGWFQRGTKVMCTGFRKEDTFIGKTYKNTPTHQLYKITAVSNDGTEIELVHERGCEV